MNHERKYYFFIIFQPNLNDMLTYCMKLCTESIQHKGLREKVLRLMVRLYSNLDTSDAPLSDRQPDYVSICQVLILLNDAHAVSEMLRKLVLDKAV